VCTDRTALAPSPTAAATRFIEPCRTSPTAKTPGTLVSKGRGPRPSTDQISPNPLDVLSPRELEVLGLMAEGRSNAGIAHQLWITEGTVEKHVHSILTKLRLPATEDDQRRVLAVITFLDAR
jgi:DNA-binding NarL/FixJ family response regulator